MNNFIIVDTGPIVGMIRRDDQWSDWVIEMAKGLRPPFLTCEPVITEASFILRRFPGGKQKLLGLIEKGVLKIEFSLSEEVAPIRALIDKYDDVPMSLADACLVRMSEMLENSAVFTVDSDFLIYRKSGRKKIPLISPF